VQTELNEKEAAHAKAVREMFAGIASRYDLLNHVLSLNIDKRWRRLVAEELRDILDRDDAIVLDVACGTGDLSLELNKTAKARIIGTDFCRPMLAVAFEKNASEAEIPYVEADAMTHYMFARFSFREWSYLINVWGRPLCTGVYAVPAHLAGVLGARVMSLAMMPPVLLLNRVYGVRMT